MESKALVFKNGHFYDTATKKRIGLKDGAQIAIAALEEDFVHFSFAGSLPDEKLNPEQKALKISNERDIAKYKKIFGQGSFLYFSITHTANGKTIAHEFEVQLLEDLYLYLKRNWKQQEGKLFDCACVVRKNISRTIDFFEEVNAKSLNEAYKSTYVHYFGNEGSPACNAIDRFYEKPGEIELTIRRFRNF